MPRAKILLIFGTRPEAVKMAPIVRTMRQSHSLVPIVCLTGQHREMVEQILPLFDVRPDFDLDLMAPDQTPSDVAAAVFRELPAVLATIDPHLVLVQGDTTTAMAAAITAHYARVPVGHVEAGLRTGQLYQPFPEEVNRKIISAVTTLHFAPTQLAADRLLAESVDPEAIHITGNTVVDALHFLLDQLPRQPSPAQRTLLVTAHRRESHGEPLRSICRAIRSIARNHPDIRVIFPVHPNPNVRVPVYEILAGQPRVDLVPPMSYLEFIGALQTCHIALTDSGGLQEEAPVLGKPVLVMRDHTERQEAIDAGCAVLVGTNESIIVARAGMLLDNPAEYARMSTPASPFGDGHAALRIVRAIDDFADTRSPAYRLAI